MLGACFAFILVEFVLFMILGLIFSKGGKEDLGNGEVVFFDDIGRTTNYCYCLLLPNGYLGLNIGLAW